MFLKLDRLRQSVLLIFFLSKSQGGMHLSSRWLDREGPQYSLTVSYVPALHIQRSPGPLQYLPGGMYVGAKACC